MSETKQEYANPGDTIEITNEKLSTFGKQFVVVPVPAGYFVDDSQIGDAWVLALDDVGSEVLPRWYRFCSYKVVQRSGRSVSQDTKSVDVSLEKQRDANLRRVFG